MTLITLLLREKEKIRPQFDAQRDSFFFPNKKKKEVIVSWVNIAPREFAFKSYTLSLLGFFVHKQQK